MRRLPSWPVWLIALGAVLMGLAALAVYRSVGFNADTFAALARPGAVDAVLLVFLGLAGSLLFLVGLIAYVIRGSLSPRAAERGYASLGTILACFGVATIVANVLTLPYFLLHPHPTTVLASSLTAPELTLAAVAMEASLFGVVYLRIIHPRVLSWEQMGLTLAKLSDRAGAGIAVGVAVIAGNYGLTAILARFGIQQTQQDLFAGVQNATPAQFVGLVLTVGAIVPVCEEIFFRGYIFTAVRRRYGLAPAFVASSLLFALAHANAEAFLPLLFVGVSFCYVYWRSGSLLPSMLAHGINNTLALVALYVSK